MADALAQAHLDAKERLQKVIAAAVATLWRQLPHYDRANIDQWLSTVLPLTAAANRQVVALTQAYAARATGQQPPALDAARIIAGIRNGATPEQVYQRPFVTVWSELKQGIAFEQAVKLGQDRAATIAETDAQLSFTHTLANLGSVRGYERATFERIPNSDACDLCQAASGQSYYTGDLLPMHGNCRCAVAFAGYSDGGSRGSSAGRVGDEFTADTGPDGSPVTVAVRDHGELGPVLTNAAQHWLTESEALARDGSDTEE